MKKIVWFSSLLSIFIYVIFVFVVLGFKGSETPEIATLALGPLFIFLGIFTMFTTHLALGNALEDHFKYDHYLKKKKAWFLSSVIPIFFYLIVSSFEFFSFTRILSIGGVVSGGMVAVLSLLMVRKAKRLGDRKPEYSVPMNWFLIFLFSLIFVAGVVREVILVLG